MGVATLASMYFTSSPDWSSSDWVLVVEAAPDIEICEDPDGVSVVDATVYGGVEVVLQTRRSGTVVGTSCVACIVVLSAGAKASSSMASQLNGWMPVFLNALRMVSGVKAFV